MNARGSLVAWLAAGMLAGCAAPAGEEPSGEAPAPDEVLELSVDSVDVVHGALRIAATMVGGSADVSVRLGGECEHRDVGGGLATPSALVWSFGDGDVAEAIGCGLVVRAHARDGGRKVDRVAELAVQVDVGTGESGDEDAPTLQSIMTATESGIRLAFASVSRSARLTTAGSVLTRLAPEDDTESADDGASFDVSRLDFARSVLRRQPLLIDGAPFPPTLSVGGTALEDEPQGETATATPPEP
jgi:hypothetical protein